jgi:hypothetical protein
MIALLMAVSLLAGQEQPEENLCADARNCRLVEEVEIRAGGRTLTVPIDEEIPFVSQDGLQLFPGESVVVAISEDGRATVESHGPAQDIITPQKLRRAINEMNAHMQSSGSDVAPGTIDPISEQRPQGRLRISMLQVPGSEDTVVLIENGYGRQIDYTAVMQVPGRQQPESTTVCEILPRLMALEHWPHPIVVIVLDDFRFVPESDELVCD